jgi:hypothetical protein
VVDDPSAPDLPSPDDATLWLIEVAVWLEDCLVKPQRISEVIARWCGGRQELQRNGYPRWVGGRDREHQGQSIEDLNLARDLLGVQAFESSDGCMWWRLPAVEQAPPLPPPDQCPTCGGETFWRNCYDAWLCGFCHEPTLPEMVKEWVRPQQEAA